MSSPNSVGVKSDILEMLSVGEEIVAIRSSVNRLEEDSISCGAEGDSTLYEMEEGISIPTVIGRSWGVKATGVSTSSGTSVAKVPSSSPPGP